MYTVQAALSTPTSQLDTHFQGLQVHSPSPHHLLVEVEVCTNCDAHTYTVRHSENKYKDLFERIKQKCLAHSIVVKKKHPPASYHKNSPYCPSTVYYETSTNEVVYFPRVGSFQIYVNGKIIFSKLQTFKWPNLDLIYQAILTYSHQDQNSSQQPSEVQLKPNQAEGKIEKQQYKGKIEKQPYIFKDFQNKRYRLKNQYEESMNTSQFKYSLEKRNLFTKINQNYLHRSNRNSSSSNIKKKQVNFSLSKLEKLNEQLEKFNNQEIEKDHEKIKGKNLKNNVRNQKKSCSSKEKNKHLFDIQPVNVPIFMASSNKLVKKNEINVYLQPIYPKTSVNLQNYNKMRVGLTQKIHKNQKIAQQQLRMNAKFNNKVTLLNRSIQNTKMQKEDNQNLFANFEESNYEQGKLTSKLSQKIEIKREDNQNRLERFGEKNMQEQKYGEKTSQLLSNEQMLKNLEKIESEIETKIEVKTRLQIERQENFEKENKNDKAEIMEESKQIMQVERISEMKEEKISENDEKDEKQEPDEKLNKQVESAKKQEDGEIVEIDQTAMNIVGKEAQEEGSFQQL